MNSDSTVGGGPRMEDYGSPATDAEGESSGQYSGGTEGTDQGSGEGEMFGEFGNTNTGTDLTVEMENSDVRSGLVKGGEAGASDAAGPGRYGGDEGAVTSEGGAGSPSQGPDDTSVM